MGGSEDIGGSDELQVGDMKLGRTVCGGWAKLISKAVHGRGCAIRDESQAVETNDAALSMNGEPKDMGAMKKTDYSSSSISMSSTMPREDSDGDPIDDDDMDTDRLCDGSSSSSTSDDDLDTEIAPLYTGTGGSDTELGGSDTVRPDVIGCTCCDRVLFCAADAVGTPAAGI